MTGADAGEGRTERLLAGYSGRMFVALAAGGLVVNLGRKALPPLLPTIIDDLAITAATAGLALTVSRAMFALTQYPGGRLSDRLSRKTVVVAGLVVIAAGFALLTRVGTFGALVIAGAFVGTGSGFFMISQRALLSDLFVKRRGTAFGVSGSVGRVGSALSGVLAVAAVAVATWQAYFLPVVVLTGVALLLLHRWSREPYVVEAVDLDVRRTVARVLGEGRIRWLVLVYTLVIFTWEGALGFLPTFLQVGKGMSPAFAGAAFSLVFVTGMAAQPVAGRVSDRVGRIAVVGAAIGLAVLGVVLLISATSRLAVGVAIVAFAAGTSGFTVAMQAHLMDIFPDSSMGGDLGAFKTVYESLGSLGPAYVGVVAARTDYVLAFSGFVPCLLCGAGIVFWLARSDGPGAGG